MRERFFHLLAAACFLGSAAQAQAPGYLGKTFIISYNAAMAPSPRYPLGVIIGDDFKIVDKKPVTLNYRSNFVLEYVISRSTSLGLCYDITQTYSKYQLEVVYNNAATQYGSVSKIYAGAPGVFIKHYHFRKSGSIAPVGYYDKFSFFDYAVNSSGALSSGTNLTTFELKNYHAFAMSYEYGKQIIFKNRVFLNIGGEMGILFTSSPSFTNEYSFAKDAVYVATASRVFNQFLFNFKVGTGLLLF